jgi:hypothetical protein
MKKAKLMLGMTLVLAIAGAIAAFKAKTFGTSKYCFTITDDQPSPADCTFKAQNKVARPKFTGDPMVYYTETNNLENCGLLACTHTGIPDQE